MIPAVYGAKAASRARKKNPKAGCGFISIVVTLTAISLLGLFW